MNIDELIKLKLVHEIHTSERRSFRACRRRWNWIFRENYYPIMTAKPLEFGVAYHKGMETYYDPKTWDWDREVVAALAIQDFATVCEEQRTKAIEANGFLEEDVQTDYNERVELGKGMLNYYFNKVAPKEDRGWKPAKVEIAFMLPIPNPETGEDVIWCKCDQCWEKFTKWQGFDDWFANADDIHHMDMSGVTLSDKVRLDTYHKNWWQGLPVVYAGRLDMLAVDDNGNYWIFDWKTARSISTDTEFLYLDDQIGSYVWALRKLGLNIRGFVYHEQRKGYPQSPQRNKTVRLGCSFSVNKNQDVDYDTFLATVMAEDKEAYESGCYDSFLTYLRNEGITYFARHQIAKSRAEIDNIEKNIGLEALDIIDEKLRLYPSAGRFGCNFCAFRQPCMEMNDGSDFQYALDTTFEKREHYYVRQAASTESKGGE